MIPDETLDPERVPLPHGTEVVLRGERRLGDRTVPGGTIGRVVALHGDALDVAIPGIGTVRCARSELSPRRPGQMRFAARREAAWRALRPCVVLEATVGSHAWGLADASSDHDLRGIFAPPLAFTVGLAAPPTDLVSLDGSATYWCVDKAVRQGLRADPNTLETLFVPDVRAFDEIGEWLLQERDAFVSAEIYGSFGRYAISQLRRLQQSLRLADHRGSILEWLESEPTLDLDGVAERLACATFGATPPGPEAVLRCKEWVKQLYRSLHDQGLLPASDFASLAWLAREGAHDFELPRDLRPKNAYNLVRLLWTATDWLRTGVPRFQVEGTQRDRLLAIKHGEVALPEVLVEAEACLPELEAARAATKLPKRADVARVDALLRRIGEELARRWIARAPGPFGRDAAEPPAALGDP